MSTWDNVLAVNERQPTWLERKKDEKTCELIGMMLINHCVSDVMLYRQWFSFRPTIDAHRNMVLDEDEIEMSKFLTPLFRQLCDLDQGYLQLIPFDDENASANLHMLTVEKFIVPPATRPFLLCIYPIPEDSTIVKEVRTFFSERTENRGTAIGLMHVSESSGGTIHFDDTPTHTSTDERLKEI